MNLKALFLISALSLGLAACGGGGGGSTTTTPTTPTPTPTTNTNSGTSSTTPPPENPSYKGDKTAAGTPILTDASTKQRAGYYPATNNVKDLPAGGPKSSKVLAEDSFYQTYRGPTPNDDILVVIKSASYIASDGNPYASYGIDDADVVGLPISAIEGERDWTNIEYMYSTANKSNEVVGVTSNTNGKITMRGTDWKAELGEVTLDGTINGTVVSGNATGNFDGKTVVGTFAGSDANYGPAKIPATAGGFAGNDKDMSFAGGWLGIDQGYDPDE